jgi:hypothetical protein
MFSKVSRTSSIGTCSSELLSHFMKTLDRQKKSWDAAINNNPAFLSKNPDAVECHRSERLRGCADSGRRSGDVSESSVADPLAGGPCPRASVV